MVFRLSPPIVMFLPIAATHLNRNFFIHMRARFTAALRAGFVHLLLTGLVAGSMAWLVFGLWFPWPLYELVGGRDLFLLVVGVDLVCGPLLTTVLWNPAKPRPELFWDLSLVAAVQIAALAYGMHTVAIARPVHIVFEVDRLRVVTASEIEAADLPFALEEFRRLPWTGPTLASIREAQNSQELLNSVDLSMGGQEPSQRPGWWQAYALGLPQLFQRARSLEVLAAARPKQKQVLQDAVKASGLPEADLLWLPLTSARSLDWVVLLDKKSGLPRAYASIDGFF